MSPERSPRPRPPRRGSPNPGRPATARRPPPPGPRKAAASGLGGEQVEGRRAVRELLVAGRRRTRSVWVADSLEASALLTEILELARVNNLSVTTVARGRLEDASRTEAPQGVIAWADPVPEVDLTSLTVRGQGQPAPFLVVLDGVTDPHNLGALLRSATCAGATGAVIPRHRSAHLTPTVAKAAAGAIEHLPIALVPGIPSALVALARAGVWTVGLDADASAGLWDLEVATESIALVLGSEGHGLSRLARDRCELVVSIPQSGLIPSLNVAAAGALACFEVSRRRSAPTAAR